MKAVTIRGVPKEVHRAIRVRAAQHGRSLQAEMRDILTTAVKPDERVKLGQLLSNIGHKAQISDEEMAVFKRDSSSARTASFD